MHQKVVKILNLDNFWCTLFHRFRFQEPISLGLLDGFSILIAENDHAGPVFHFRLKRKVEISERGSCISPPPVPVCALALYRVAGRQTNKQTDKIKFWGICRSRLGSPLSEGKNRFSDHEMAAPNMKHDHQRFPNPNSFRK